MDPVLAHVCRGVLALVFLSAAAHKLRAPRDFVATLRGYGLVPGALAPAVAALLVGAELAIGAGLLAPATQRAAALGATALLALYGASIAVNLLRGRRDIDCGCGGPAARQPLSGWLVLRNVVSRRDGRSRRSRRARAARSARSTGSRSRRRSPCCTCSTSRRTCCSPTSRERKALA